MLAALKSRAPTVERSAARSCLLQQCARFLYCVQKLRTGIRVKRLTRRSRADFGEERVCVLDSVPMPVGDYQRERGLLLVPCRRLKRVTIVGPDTRCHHRGQSVQLGSDQASRDSGRRVFVTHSEQVLPNRRNQRTDEYSDEAEDG